MGRTSKGRSAMACKACHAQKLKCNGGTPCERCQLRRKECVYPVRDKFIHVPESYLRHLERAQRGAAIAPSSPGLLPEPVHRESHNFASPISPEKRSRAVKEELLEDCSPEFFVRRLKQLSWSYTYSRLDFDFLQPEVSFRLPPRPYAFLLLKAFEEGFSEYHWFRRKRFQERLILTYSDPDSQSHDRNWLCRVSVVLALAESFNRSRMTSSTHLKVAGQQPSSNAGISATLDSVSPPLFDLAHPSQSLPLPPGSDFFDQGLKLLKMSHEEPVPEDVEALNLIAFYCYSLNRRKTAYSYASQSVALAKLLQLHKPRALPESTTERESVCMENEHRKRLWWTSYCMDRMISLELGVTPTLASVPEGMKLPSSFGLTPEQSEEFSDPSLLTASIQLCEIKRNVIVTAAQHGDIDDEKRLDAIKPCIDMLQQWRAGLPQAMAFSFDDDLPTRLMEAQYGRILASIYLRYHQCYILLLRPLYLQKLSSILQQRRMSIQQFNSSRHIVPSVAVEDDPMNAVKIQCLQAARNNCKILLGLWNYDKIAKFGYWESLHLFSGLAILVLARVSVDRTEQLFPPAEDDTALYTRTRALLSEMACVGNPAAKDHDALLSDVEAMVKRVSEEEKSTSQVIVGTEDMNVSLNFPELNFADLDSEQSIWCDADWESILSTYTQGI
ncbi:uncharacterized protein CTRU02_206381 [Colletotrichum truncatum]|uniref:Uncharacterized protein n=1 Tax=Colletotrichum truncatum TaxID=5467 RepID=A0ACC3Z6Q7_COLTU